MIERITSPSRGSTMYRSPRLELLRSLLACAALPIFFRLSEVFSVHMKAGVLSRYYCSYS